MVAEHKCEICGAPMPPGEEMFKYHGFSGPCPIPPKPRSQNTSESLESLKSILADHLRSMDRQVWMGRLWAIVNQAYANGFAEGMQRMVKPEKGIAPCASVRLAEEYHGQLVSILGAIAAIPEAAGWATKQFSDKCRENANDPSSLTLGQVVSIWDSLRPTQSV